MEYGLKDNVKARICDGTGENRYKTNDEPPFRSQNELMNHYIKLENENAEKLVLKVIDFYLFLKLSTIRSPV